MQCADAAAFPAPMIWAQNIKDIKIVHVGQSYSTIPNIAEQANRSSRPHTRETPAGAPDEVRDIEDICGPVLLPEAATYDWNCGEGHPGSSHSTQMGSLK